MAAIDPSAAKAAGGENGAAKAGGEDTAAKKAGADNQDASKLGAKGASKLSPGTEKVDNGDGTYTLKGKLKDGTAWSKTFTEAPGDHVKDHPNADYVAKVKAKLSQGLDGDQPGQDTNNDKMYKGKSLEAGKGGRSAMMVDRITMELVNKGYSEEAAHSIAKKQAAENGVKKYGQKQMDEWAGKGKATKAA